MPRNERLRQHRIERNWRQQEVADQLGIALVTVQRWERGFQQPSAYYRAKFSALFGKSAQELGLLEASSLSAPAEHEAPAAVPPAAAATLPDEQHLLALPGHDAQEQMQVVTAVKRWLQDQPDWLLILDNADDLSLLPDFCHVKARATCC